MNRVMDLLRRFARHQPEPAWLWRRFVIVWAIVTITAVAGALPGFFSASAGASVASGHHERLRERAYHEALSHAGAWYCWGGTGPCFDCSGLVSTSYAPWVSIGRDTYDMLANRHLRRISPGHQRQGDLAFFGTGHVELVAGKHFTFGAHQTGEPVSLRRISPYFAPTAYYRVVP